MPESCEENSDLPSKSKPQEEHGFAMDFDIYLESSWPFDHITSASNPMSPFFMSTSSEQPFSPLWAFSDVEDDNKPVRVVAGSGFSEGHRFLSCLVLLLCFWFVSVLLLNCVV